MEVDVERGKDGAMTGGNVVVVIVECFEMKSLMMHRSRKRQTV